MKVSFRTVSGESFQLDAEASTTVGGLKDLLVEARSIQRDAMKLVYRGKVLDNEAATVAECAIDEQGFVVLFVTKKTEPPKAATTPAPASTPAVPSTETSAAAATPPAATHPAAPAAVAAPTAAPTAVDTGSAFGSLLTGSALETAVSNICEMGFPREDVMRAMRAAFNNPERAVEYLMTGIPASANPPPPAAPAAPAAAPPTAATAAVGPGAQPFNMFGPAPPAAGAAPGAAPGGGAGALEFLRNSPQFQLLRQAVRGNPGILTPMLQELGRANPQIIQMINSNQEDFLRMLQEEPGEGEMDLGSLMAAGGFGGGEEGEEGGEGGGVVVNLTEEDVAKVDRLMGLGFPREACIEALIACDRNEELAANFLAEQMFD
ncbi:hypothetical protein CEUSTIGMA_g7417.t1 [Chlamydomonas eustigma]|uniref:Ubiquitin receptor RAD23 n=1 Tax=Chlamydomonas eustigma TaxID=1157962 RepID=A0A250XA71_9CHLO|nr:hypothetical protein CEUSTIGMA_g7417.t1 [Chlamydomonas eustigma]|eukprot:GAX79978.1 hypothetical protein CEUSTIGMA_g7417.t1 [Chlamydomonas eustigma]